MDISTKLCAVAKKLKASYMYNGKPITYEEIFSPKGLLPPLVKRADQLASLCMGYGLGASFEEVDKSNSLLGKSVKFDETTPDILRILCILDVLNEIIKNAPSKERVSLDELIYEY